jgi:hypothetical protein
MADRHSKTRAVSAAAIKGYLSELVEHFPNQNEFRLLVSGFGRFFVPDNAGGMPEVINNPSQDFVTHEENFDGAMQIAFGSNQVKQATLNSEVFRYRVRIGQREVELQILGVLLQVDDSALNEGLPGAIRSFQPNAILSTGTRLRFSAELRASNGGLGITSDGKLFHDANIPASYVVNNPSLWNAILQGSAKP